MASYTAIITTAGLALLNAAANGAGQITFTNVSAGSGLLGATNPLTLTDIITPQQSSNVVNAQQDNSGHWYAYLELTNYAVSTAYTRTEIGLFAEITGQPSTQCLLAYLYVTSSAYGDYIPAAGGGAAIITELNIKITGSAGLTATVTIDQSSVYLPLSRWNNHLAGAGGADQHPLATITANGMMPASIMAALETFSIGQSGYAKLPGSNFYLQWGFYTYTGGHDDSGGAGAKTVFFPIPFPNGCFVVCPTVNYTLFNASNNFTVDVIGTPTAVGFQVDFNSINDSDAIPAGCFWLAIGY